MDNVGSFAPSPRMNAKGASASMVNASNMMRLGPNTNTASSMYSKHPPPRGSNSPPKKKKGKKKKTLMQKAAKKTGKLLGWK